MKSRLLIFIFAFLCLKITNTAPLSEHGECRNKIADVVFAIDTSESIWEEDFQQQLDFVTHIVQQFDIGHDRVRVGMITFGSTVHHQFHLKDFHEKRKLISEILTVKYVGGGTNTAGAIAHARNVMFKHTNGGRDNADKILIVITDGFSKNTTKAAMEASICRNVGIKIFTIGVGHGVDNFELTAIANRPSDRNEKFSLRVDDFDGLKEIEMEVADEICKAMSIEEKQNDGPGFTDQVEEDIKRTCGGKPADIYFVIDSSSSIMEHNFRKMLSFVNNVIDLFHIAPDKIRIGVVLFSDGINPLIHLDNTFSKNVLKQKISNAPYLGGGTRTGATLQYIRKRGFSNEQARRHVAHIAIILTDGQSEDMDTTIREAKLAHKQGIYLFTVGIGDQIDRQELKVIASEPTGDFMLEISDFDALSSINSILAIKTCTAHSMLQDETKRIFRHLDVMYVFNSFTMGQKKTNIIMDFISDVIEQTSDHGDSIHSGVLMQSSSHHNIPLTSNEYAGELLLKSAFSQSKGLSDLLRNLRHHGFRTENGGRYEAQNVAVIFVDGNLSDYHELLMEAKRVEFRSRTELFVIAIGGNADDNGLASLCSKPVSKHIFKVQSFGDLNAIKPELISQFVR